jgi:hypothetical protein
MKIKGTKWSPKVNPNFFDTGILDAVYNTNNCLNCSGEYVEKYRAYSSFLVQLYIYKEVINMKITHPQTLLDKQTSYILGSC